MGKVRTRTVKRLARELLKNYPDKFTANFEENKNVLKSLAEFSSKRLRNRVAGYITRLIKSRQLREGGS